MGRRNNTGVAYRIGVIGGDGIGPEVIEAACIVLDATGLGLEFVELDAGWETFRRTGTALPSATIDALEACHGALFGAVSSPSQQVAGYTSPIVAMRNHFTLYANLRPVYSAPIPNSRANIDMLIVRENTECLYVKRERLDAEGERAVAERVITRSASERIAHVAFREAQRRGRSPGMVTIVHKANVLSVTDGLFRESALRVSADYKGVATEEQLIDSMVYRIIVEPERYDVIVAPNLYGDILSDAAAALVGGLGLAPSANVGEHFLIAEPVHGSAPGIAGKGIANPIAAIRSAGMLLEALDEKEWASKIRTATDSVLADKVWTPDLGGVARTGDVTEAIAAQLRHLG